MATERAPRSPGLQALHDQFIGDDPERVASYERARADADIAQHIYDLRTEAGLTQRELAARVGTTASAISRLEDADYDGHSMAMLRRIAEALGRRVVVQFVALAAKDEGSKPATGTASSSARARRKSAAIPTPAPPSKVVGQAARKAGKKPATS